VKPAAAALLVLATALVGCSSDDSSSDSGSGSKDTRAAVTESQTGTVTATHTRSRPNKPRVQAAHCPATPGNCKTASGQIIYVEAVDPDGDGDAHFVLTSRQSISLPGISVIDVEKNMRPHPLPKPGDWVSAAGPVYRGSYGQSQIQATELHVGRAGSGSR
jgi:hypothetical protein